MPTFAGLHLLIYHLTNLHMFGSYNKSIEVISRIKFTLMENHCWFNWILLPWNSIVWKFIAQTNGRDHLKLSWKTLSLKISITKSLFPLKAYTFDIIFSKFIHCVENDKHRIYFSSVGMSLKSEWGFETSLENLRRRLCFLLLEMNLIS